MPSIVTSAEWRFMNPPFSADVRGLNSPTLEWGLSDEYQSGCSFTGETVDVPLDGTTFTLGKFRHRNYHSPSTESFYFIGARIRLQLADDSVAARQPAQDFDFYFRYRETLNVPQMVDDEFNLQSMHSCETIEIDGTQYALVIMGFEQNGQTVTTFKSPENGDNEVNLVAKLVPAETIAVFTFQVCNPDGMCVGQGRFSYIGVVEGIDIAYTCCGSSQGPSLLYFEYKDILFGGGMLTIWDLQSLYFMFGADGACRFAFNAFSRDGTAGISTGFSTNERPGLVNTRRSGERDESGMDLTVSCPKPVGWLCPPRPDGPTVPSEQCEDQLKQVKEECDRWRRELEETQQELERCKQGARGGIGGGGEGGALVGGGGEGGGGMGGGGEGGGRLGTKSPLMTALPPPGGEVIQQLTTMGWAMYHPLPARGTDEYAVVAGWVPAEGKFLKTWDGPFSGAPQHGQSFRWRFEETGVPGEFRIRPVPVSLRGGTVLYATAPATAGDPFIPNTVVLKPRHDHDSQIWKIGSSPDDPYAIAILPKGNPGYFLAGPWKRDGWLWLYKIGEPWPYGPRQGSPTDDHRWKLRAV